MASFTQGLDCLIRNARAIGYVEYLDIVAAFGKKLHSIVRDRATTDGELLDIGASISDIPHRIRLRNNVLEVTIQLQYSKLGEYQILRYAVGERKTFFQVELLGYLSARDLNAMSVNS